MKLECRFCKIQFICESFEQIAMVQNEDCYITRIGIKHDLRAIKEPGV